MGVCGLWPYLRKHVPLAFHTLGEGELPSGVRSVAVDFMIVCMQSAKRGGDVCVPRIAADVYNLALSLVGRGAQRVDFLLDGDHHAGKADWEAGRREERRVADAAALRGRIEALRTRMEGGAAPAAGGAGAASAPVSTPASASGAAPARGFATLSVDEIALDDEVVVGAADAELTAMRGEMDTLLRAQRLASVFVDRDAALRIARTCIDMFDGEFERGSIGFAVAPDDAERAAASLYDLVVTEDGDALASGAPLVLRGAAGATPTVVVLSEILETLRLTPAEWRRACVLAGCDYAPHLQRMGFATALRVVRRLSARAAAAPDADAVEAFPKDWWREACAAIPASCREPRAAQRSDLPAKESRALFLEEVARPAFADAEAIFAERVARVQPLT